MGAAATIDYDRNADVLYLIFSSSKAAAAYIDVQEGIVLRVEQEEA